MITITNFNNKYLKEVLERVRGGVDNNTNHEIFKTVLFAIKDKELLLRTNNSELEITTKIEINSAQNIRFNINFKDIYDTLLTINNDENITLSIKEKEELGPEETDSTKTEIDKVFLTNNKNQFIINALYSNEIGDTTTEIKEKLSKINKENLLYSIKKVKFSIANDSPQQFLNGLLLEIEKKKVSVVASDGHRLSMSEFAADSNKIEKAIIPQKTINEIIKILSRSTQKFVFFAINDDGITLKDGTTTIKSNLISGTYPDYKSIIPNNINTEILINNSSFIQALRQVEVFTKEDKTVNLRFVKDTLIINAKSQKGRGEVIIDTKGFADELTTDFNVGYLLQTIQNIDENNIVFRINNIEKKILMLVGEKNTKSQYLIMPVRV